MTDQDQVEGESRPKGKRLSPEFAPGQSPSTEYIVKVLSPYKALIGGSVFLFFAIESILAVICKHLYGDSDALLKMMFTQLLAVNSTFSGLLHFYPPLYEFYTSMIFVPFKSFWLYFTGLLFISSGLMIAFTKTQVIGSWILFITFIIVTPGNMACIIDPYPRNQVCAGSLIGSVIRLLFQYNFIVWSLWLTTKPIPVF